MFRAHFTCYCMHSMFVSRFLFLTVSLCVRVFFHFFIWLWFSFTFGTFLISSWLNVFLKMMDENALQTNMQIQCAERFQSSTDLFIYPLKCKYIFVGNCAHEILALINFASTVRKKLNGTEWKKATKKIGNRRCNECKALPSPPLPLSYHSIIARTAYQSVRWISDKLCMLNIALSEVHIAYCFVWKIHRIHTECIAEIQKCEKSFN